MSLVWTQTLTQSCVIILTDQFFFNLCPKPHPNQHKTSNSNYNSNNPRQDRRLIFLISFKKRNEPKKKKKIEAKNCLEVVGWIFYKDDCDIDIYVD